MLISVDWLPPYWCPSRRLLRSRLEGRGLVTRSKIAPKTGAASPPMARDRDQGSFTPLSSPRLRSRRDRHRPGDRPGEGGHLPSDRDDDLVHVFAPRAQEPVPLAQSHLGLPGDGTDVGGNALQAKLQMATDLGRIPIGPRPFDQGAPGMAVPGLGDGALVPARPGRILRGREAEVAHQLARRIEPRDVAHLGKECDGAGEIETAEGLD